MRFVTKDDPIAVIFGCCRFSGSAVKADPDVASFAPVLTKPVAAFKVAIAARQEADDTIADAHGVVAYRERLLHQCVIAVSRKAFAHFASRMAPGYLKILPKAATDILKMPQADRRKILLAMIDALAEKGLPAEFAQLSKDLAAAQKNREAADAAVVAAELAFGKARTAEGDAKDAVVVGYRSLHAQLTLKFEQDKPRVESYFRSPPKKVKTPAPAAG